MTREIITLSPTDLQTVRDILLRDHNALRTCHSSPPMTLYDYLNKGDSNEPAMRNGNAEAWYKEYSAQAYADYLAEDDSRWAHADYLNDRTKVKERLGENLGYSEFYSDEQCQLKDIVFIARGLVGALYNEIKDYTFTPSSGFRASTGHFTQIVWKASTALGVGIGVARLEEIVKDKKRYKYDLHLVVRYLNAGNGSDFETNVIAPTSSTCVKEKVAEVDKYVVSLFPPTPPKPDPSGGRDTEEEVPLDKMEDPNDQLNPDTPPDLEEEWDDVFGQTIQYTHKKVEYTLKAGYVHHIYFDCPPSMRVEAMTIAGQPVGQNMARYTALAMTQGSVQGPQATFYDKIFHFGDSVTETKKVIVDLRVLPTSGSSPTAQKLLQGLHAFSQRPGIWPTNGNGEYAELSTDVRSFPHSLACYQITVTDEDIRKNLRFDISASLPNEERKRLQDQANQTGNWEFGATGGMKIQVDEFEGVFNYRYDTMYSIGQAILQWQPNKSGSHIITFFNAANFAFDAIYRIKKVTSQR